MESINFNDFSERERHEIITAFLIKMRKANSMQSAQNFFEFYLKQFYKLPPKLTNDIIYCQRAMKSYLSVHQKVTNFYGMKTDADSETNKYLQEIEDVLHELNAECQYLVICLEEDIEKFCLPFSQQQMQPNVDLISEMVSQAVVPHVCTNLLALKPHFVRERPAESLLLRKYFTTSKDTKISLNSKDESPKPTRIVAPNKKPVVAAAPRPVAKRPAILSSEAASKDVGVNTSRLNLQEALKRARLNQNQNTKTEPKAKSSKELFLHSVGLCTHVEHKSIIVSQKLNHKRKPKLVQK